MATPPSRLTFEELKRNLVDELTRELKDVDTAAAALAAQGQRIEMTKLALQVQVETRLRAEKELLAAAENLRKSKNDYLLSGRVVPVGHDIFTRMASARHAFLRARDRYRSALEVAAKHAALLALVDRRLHKEAIKLDLLETAFKFSSKLMQYALRVAVLDGSLP